MVILMLQLALFGRVRLDFFVASRLVRVVWLAIFSNCTNVTYMASVFIVSVETALRGINTSSLMNRMNV